MICQKCNEKMATILFAQVIQGKKTEMHLCKMCAQKKGISGIGGLASEPVNSFLAGMTEKAEALVEDQPRVVCTKCNLTYREFRASGKLGCAECYSAFDEPLKKLIRKTHGNTQHHGKTPVRHIPRSVPDTSFNTAQRALKEAIAQENYERAAELRDQIRAQKQSKDTPEEQA